MTFICRDPLENIPPESRAGAKGVLAQALNVRNRDSKQLKFGFSSSEDAVTWVVFSYLYRSGQLVETLRRAGIIGQLPANAEPALLLWGVPIDGRPRGMEIRERLRSLCATLMEDHNSFSEPDVIVDLDSDGLIFIEVKYLSANEYKPADYPNWSRYASRPELTWQFDDVKASGCYELARNWCLLKRLAGNRPAMLVNLGSPKLFADTDKLDTFIAALGSGTRSHFIKLEWSALLGELSDCPAWFSDFYRSRQLVK